MLSLNSIANVNYYKHFMAENQSMIEDQKLRVEKLKSLIGGVSIAAFCRKFERVDPTYISQILNGHRNFGEKAARTMEEKLGLQAGWFDRDTESAWPFNSITYDEYQQLDPGDKYEIETLLGIKALKVRPRDNNPEV